MKIYCRIKVNGKWTFRAACLNYIHLEGHVIDCDCNSLDLLEAVTE